MIDFQSTLEEKEMGLFFFLIFNFILFLNFT